MQKLERLGDHCAFQIGAGIRRRLAYRAAAGCGFTPLDMQSSHLERLIGPFDYESTTAEAHALAVDVFPDLGGGVSFVDTGQRISDLANAIQGFVSVGIAE